MDKLRSSSIMSQGFGNVYKKVLKDRRLTKVAKLIHCYLCSYAGSGDTAFPSVSLICYDLELNEGTYYEHMLYLKAYGYITVEQPQDEKGKFRKNIYTIEQFPEQFENEEYKKQIEEIMNKRKEKNKKAKTKKEIEPSMDNPSTEPSADNPSTDEPSMDDQGTNTNSAKTILYYSIWNMAKERLQKMLPEYTYNDFIGTLELFSYEDNTFIFRSPDDWFKTIVELQYKDRIHIALQEVCKVHNIYDFKILIKV